MYLLFIDKDQNNMKLPSKIERSYSEVNRYPIKAYT